MERRLADLEREAEAQERAWLESLSTEELNAQLDPETRALVDALVDVTSDDEADRYLDGRMSPAEFERLLERARERLNAT